LEIFYRQCQSGLIVKYPDYLSTIYVYIA